MLLSQKKTNVIFENNKNLYNIERVYNGKKLSVVKVLDLKGKIYKAIFYDESERISNLCVYNVKTGRVIKNVTYKADGKTVSSVRVYNEETSKLEKVAFYKNDGKNISSIVLYNKNGTESECVMFCDDGEVVKFNL